MPSRKYSASPDSHWTFNSTIRESQTNSAVAKLEYRRSKEEGKIVICATNAEYEISHESRAGIWRLRPVYPSSDTEIVATKPKWYRNHFHLEKDGKNYAMLPLSRWRRDFSVHKVPTSDISYKDVMGNVVGELKRVKWSKHYDVSFDEEVGLELTAFCFWLVNLMRRRDQQGNSVAGAGAAGGAAGGC